MARTQSSRPARIDSDSVPTVAPSEQDELRINGLSLLFYDFYLITDVNGSNFNDTFIELLNSPHHYNLLFDVTEADRKNHDIYFLRTPLTLTPIQLPTAGIAKGTMRLIFQVVGAQFLLAITEINVDRSDDIIDGPQISVDQPLRVEDVLTLINELNHPEGSLFESLENQRDRAVRSCFGPTTKPINAVQSTKNVAMQIWEIDNLQLQPTDRVDGIQLSYQFAWELSALLECNSDLIRVHRAWRERHVHHIQSLVQHGTDVLADHRVLTNRSVCLEISQVKHPTLTIRSAQRLSVFGYDSTSIYLWGYLALQEFVLGYYNRYLSTLLQQASESLRYTGGEHPHDIVVYGSGRDVLADLVKTKVALYHVLDSIYWITENMREKRHAVFFAEAVEARGLDDVFGEVERKLQELTGVATDVHQVFVSIDQRDIMSDLRSLNEAAVSTRRGIAFLSFAVAAAQAAVLADYLGKLIPCLDLPLWKGLLGIGLFGAALLLYVFLSRR